MVIPIRLKDHSENSVTAVTAFHKIKLHFCIVNFIYFRILLSKS